MSCAMKSQKNESNVTELLDVKKSQIILCNLSDVNLKLDRHWLNFKELDSQELCAYYKYGIIVVLLTN